MAKISVIIPIYNVEQYLPRCLDSVINQTLRDIEIICINDCSTDGSGAVLKDYASKDKRIKLIDLEVNKGVSATRNTGIDNSTGEYLSFIDSDDSIDIDFYEKLYNKAVESDADIVKGEVKIIDYDGNIGKDILHTQIKNNHSKLYFIYYWVSAIYRRDLIIKNNIKQKINRPLGEDILFLNQAVLKSNKVELVDQTFYNYYKRENSAYSSVLSKEKIDSDAEALEGIINNTLDYQTDDIEGKSNIFAYCIMDVLRLSYRLKTDENLDFCVNKAFYFYNKTRDFINESLINMHPLVFDCLQSGNKEDLKSFCKKISSDKELFLSKLRYNHIRRKNAKSISNNTCI